MSATKTCPTKMSDKQLLKITLEKMMGWKNIQIAEDEIKQPLSGHTYTHDIPNAILVVKSNDIPGAKYGVDFVVTRKADGTLDIHCDDHSLEDVKGFPGRYKEKEFISMLETEYAKNDLENSAKELGAIDESSWTVEEGVHKKLISIDEDQLAQLQSTIFA